METRCCARLACALVLVASLAGPARADEPAARAVRTDTPPTIDGHLDEGIWDAAPPLTDFRQRDPVEGAPATEETVVRLVYDDSMLYVGVLLHDRLPKGILAQELRRDDDLESDDTFAILLDTFHDHRNAFLFRVNPNGTRFDAVVRNESRVDDDWDEQWWASATVGAHGWTVELAIPFKTLRYRPAQAHLWGLNFERVIRRKNEAAYWTNWSRDFEFRHVSQAGTLTGIENVTQGQRFRLRPYVVAGVESLGATLPPQSAGVTGDAGIDDLKIAVTSNLTADLSVNPDFAQTEIDEQRVNLTRFSLFFPEKRQFFVEGAESLRMGPPLGDFDQEALVLFHSRRIGLSPRGEPLPIRAGGKLTGKVGGVDLGVLGARTGQHEAIPGETFGVARFRREVLGRSYFGAIATMRQVGGSTDVTLGADARFVVKRHLTLSALAARVDNRGSGPRWARHLGATWDHDFVNAQLAYLGIDPEFEPAVGFVRRNDRQTEASFSINPRPPGGPVRQLQFGPNAVLNHDETGLLLSRELEFNAEVEFQSGDELEVSFENVSEYLPEPFDITDDIVLPVGRYGWNSVRADFRAFEGRALSGMVSVEAGGFYTGDALELSLSTALRLGRHLAVRPEYEMNDVNLAEGAFTTHLVGLRSDVAVNRDVLASGFFQYNSEGQLAALQVRLTWIFRNLDNFHVVFNETRSTDGEFDGRSNRALIAKLTYSLQR
jgi:hypothetical protein